MPRWLVVCFAAWVWACTGGERQDIPSDAAAGDMDGSCARSSCSNGSGAAGAGGTGGVGAADAGGGTADAQLPILPPDAGIDAGADAGMEEEDAGPGPCFTISPPPPRWITLCRDEVTDNEVACPTHYAVAESFLDGDGDGILDDTESTYSSSECAGLSCGAGGGFTSSEYVVQCDLPGGTVRNADGGPAVSLMASNLRGADLRGLRCGTDAVAPEEPEGWNCQVQCTDLREADLSGVSLFDPQFMGANLRGANFTRANLRGADSTTANLLGADLSVVVDLRDVDFSEAYLVGANLSGADLTGVNLEGASIYGADTTNLRACPATLPDETWTCLEIQRAACDEPGPPIHALIGPGAKLNGADLSGQDLAGLNLTHVSFRDGELDWAKLTGTDLRQADLIGTELAHADLSDANLEQAWLTSSAACPAQLPGPAWACIEEPETGRFALLGPGTLLAPSGTDLRRADLRGANLEGIGLEGIAAAGADFSGANLRSASGPQDARGAKFVGADLTQRSFPFPTNLDGADLTDATVDRAFFWGTRLVGANLSGVELAKAFLSRIMACDLPSCPASLPPELRCIEELDGSYVLFGPGVQLGPAQLGAVDLSEMDFTEMDLRGAGLAGADLSGATLVSAKLDGADLSGVDFSGAELTYASLHQTQLAGAQLADAGDAVALRATDLLGCPATLPTGWSCVSGPGSQRFMLVGPYVDLSRLDLSGWMLAGVDFQSANLSLTKLDRADLANADLGDAQLSGIRAILLPSCPATLPNSLHCVATPATASFALLGSSARLEDVDLRGSDLTGIDFMPEALPPPSSVLTDATTTCPNGQPGPCW